MRVKCERECDSACRLLVDAMTLNIVDFDIGMDEGVDAVSAVQPTDCAPGYRGQNSESS